MLTGAVAKRATCALEELDRVCYQTASGDAARTVFKQAVLDRHVAQGSRAGSGRPSVEVSEHPAVVALDDAVADRDVP